MDNEFYIFIALVILLIIFFSISQAKQFRGGEIGNMITFAGIGAILGGTFFGIVKDTVLNKSPNSAITLYIIFFFFIWYIITKFISLYLIKLQNPEQKLIATGNTDKEILLRNSESTLKEIKNKNKITPLNGVFIGAIILIMIIILFVSMAQKGNADYSTYSILVTVMIILAVLFSFFSGHRLNYNIKSQIMGYTFSFALVFGILAPIFVYDSFSLKDSTTSTIIFFVWLSLTNAISNFIKDKINYINRY